MFLLIFKKLSQAFVLKISPNFKVMELYKLVEQNHKSGIKSGLHHLKFEILIFHHNNRSNLLT